MATTIQVSDPVKAELDALKAADEHSTYDSVLRALLREYNDGDD